MKKIFRNIAIIASAFAALTACSKADKVESPIENEVQGHYYTFALGRSGSTKAILASDAVGKFGQWEEGDRLGSITTKSQGFSSITPATSTSPATFSIYSQNGLEVGNTINLWYPYKTKQTNATSVTLEIPTTQNHLEGGIFDFDAMPMAAKQISVTAAMASSTTNTPLSTIDLYNLGSLLNFKVFSTNSEYANEKVERITFNANTNCAGSFSLDLTEVNPMDETTMAISSLSSNSISTFPFSTASIGTSKENALNLYMVVAPGTYSGTFEVKTNAALYTYTISGKSFARSAIKSFGLNLGSANAVRTTPIDYVTLDWDYPGGPSSDLASVVGVTTSGLGSDYTSHDPYQVKFDDTGDYIQVKTNTSIATVSVGYKMIGGNTTSHLNIFESIDGSSWSSVESLTISGAQSSTGTLTTSASFSSESRLVKIVFEKGSNVGIGNISIHKPTNWLFSSISVSTPPSVINYTVGDFFDPMGMVINATYVDESDNTHTKSEPITGYTYSPTRALLLSDSEVTISYTEGGVTKTATQAITVSSLPANSWVRTALSALTSEDVFVIVGDGFAMTNNNGTGSAPATSSVTVSGNILTSEVTNNIMWTRSGNATDGYTFYPYGSNTNWLYCTTTQSSGSNNNIRVGDGDRKVFLLDSDNYLVTNDSYVDRYLSIYNSQDWRGYINTDNAVSLTFYKYTGTLITVDAPTFSVPEGTYSSAQSVEIDCTTSGATIYYTLDGSTPDDSKNVYTSALTISSTTTVKAIAIKGGISSTVTTATYTISSTPSAASTLTLSSTKKFGTSSGSTLKDDDNNKTWTVTTTNSGTILNSYQSMYNGQQFGTGSAPWTGSFSCTSIGGTISKVIVNANTGGSATLSVKVGSTDFNCSGETTINVTKNTSSANSYEFTGSASGTVTIYLSGTSKACYFGGVSVILAE